MVGGPEDTLDEYLNVRAPSDVDGLPVHVADGGKNGAHGDEKWRCG